MYVLISVCLLAGSAVTVFQDTVPPSPALTVQERIKLFGSASYLDMPKYDVIEVRAIYHNPREPRNSSDDSSIQFQLTVFGQQLDIIMKPNPDLFYRGCLVHHFKRDGKRELYPCYEERGRCMYTGEVQNHKGSSAAANVCGGLHGVLNMDNKTLMIQPIKDQNFSSTGNRHVVFYYNAVSRTCNTPDVTDLLYVAHRLQNTASWEPEDPVSENFQYQTVNTKRYIEAAVVVDMTLSSYHGNDTEHFVHSVMNVAAERFQEKSLESKLWLVVTNILILEKKVDGLIISANSGDTLKSLCRWQTTQALTGADAVVLITRLDLEDAFGDDTIVGLANTGGMCDKNLKCLVAEDWGLGTGFTIAHEMGHLLGMNHDGNNSCEPGRYIMSPGGVSGPGAYNWSSCSRAELQKFFRNGGGKCLLNKPTVPLTLNDKPLIGTVYTADQQCKLLHGNSATECLSGNFADDVCRELNCKKDSADRCHVYSVPLADGTDCNNTRNWCLQGRCVAMGNTSAPPVDGGWTGWNEFSPCTKTCDGGVKIRKRFCKNPPPQYGGKGCSGTDIHAAICNVKACPNSGYNSDQCERAYNNSAWKISGIDLRNCRLLCSNDAYNITMSPFLENGANCGHSEAELHRCVDKQCRKFGCDGNLDSGFTFDACRKCNGWGNECKRITGTFNQQLSATNRFFNVTVIPRDSTTIRIRQTGSNCIVGLLVGGVRVQEYRRSGMYSVRVHDESINIRYNKYPPSITILDSLPADVIVQVSPQFPDPFAVYYPNVNFSYYIPTQTTSFQLTSWAVRGWTACSQSCGGGKKYPMVSCVNMSLDIVEDYKCDLKTKPSEIAATCNPQPCPASWREDKWGACSQTCGGGIKQRRIECVTKGADNSMQIVSESQCREQKKPSEKIACPVKPCPGVWSTGNWSTCSAACGTGFKHRDVKCFQDSNLNVTVQDHICLKAQKPHSKQLCVDKLCQPELCGDQCRDVFSSCADYTHVVCVNYPAWSKQNCPKFCQICDSNTNDTYPDHCARFREDGWCKSNKDFMDLRCRGSCGRCECRDTDVDCQHYDKIACTPASPYRPYMENYCSRTCNLCKENVK